MTTLRAFVFGMALAVASTVVLVRVLSDNNDLHTQAGHIAVGWLVVDARLWDRPDDGSPQTRERSRLYNTSTLLTLVLLPILYRRFGDTRLERDV